MKPNPFVFSNISASIMIIIGVILLIYMIIFEDEPGFVPLLFIGIGTAIYVVRARLKKSTHP